MESITENIQAFPTKKTLKTVNNFWLGFIIYSVSAHFAFTTQVNYVLCQGVQSIGLVLLIPALVKLIQSKFDDAYLQIIYFFYSIWLITIVIRGISFDVAFIKFLLFDPGFGMFGYFVPLIVLFPRNLSFYKKAFDAAVFLGIFFIIYDIVFIRDILNSDRTSVSSVNIVEISSGLCIPICFLLLTYPFHSNKVKIFAIAIVLLNILTLIIRARRGSTVVGLTQFISAYLLYLSNSKKKFSVFLISIFIIFFMTIYIKEAIDKGENGIFGFIMERGDEDTRTDVEICMYNDMKTKDWIIGKGIIGDYYCPGIDPDNVTGYRSVIETGYLQIILKGGLVSLGLYFLIIIPAIFKGLFYSKNTLSKGAAIWILLSVLYLYPVIIQGFSMYYIFVWVAIGICYSKNIRSMTDNNIKDYLKAENYL